MRLLAAGLGVEERELQGDHGRLAAEPGREQTGARLAEGRLGRFRPLQRRVGPALQHAQAQQVEAVAEPGVEGPRAGEREEGLAGAAGIDQQLRPAVQGIGEKAGSESRRAGRSPRRGDR